MRVSGLVLIDMPNTAQWASLAPELAEYTPDLSSSSPRVRQGVKRRFEMSTDLVNKWAFPSAADLRRPGADNSGHVDMEDFGCHSFLMEESSPSGASQSSSSSSRGAELASFASDLDLNMELQLQHQRGALPPAMLLRAVDRVPNPHPDKGEIRVDLDRASRLLGWEYNPLNFIRVVQDVPGHHYNLFEDDEKVSTISDFLLSCKSHSKAIWLSPNFPS